MCLSFSAPLPSANIQQTHWVRQGQDAARVDMTMDVDARLNKLVYLKPTLHPLALHDVAAFLTEDIQTQSQQLPLRGGVASANRLP